MRARPAAMAVLALAATASAEPKPAPVDIKPFRDQLVVLQDAQGGTYVVQPGSEGRVFYGNGKTLYEQVVESRGSNADEHSWSVAVWAPKVSGIRPGIIQRRADGVYERWCGDDESTRLLLSERTGDKAKAVLDKSAFMTTALVRTPRLLARDDAGVYYYVDNVRAQYGGKGFRVFVGKKGAMKEMPLVDIATDTAGDVFSTKTGELRLVRNTGAKANALWVRGDKRSELVVLDLDMNSSLIYKDLGVYSFLGTICDEL